ncbi:MAG: 3-phosphoshikimate 1-carboxyvinyltransferase [Ruminococcaceae bacterium]|nr:3-phosphoshikimate 1-carboxyvinyltransferase [Oscillospiraceae bacterium]
MIAEIKPGKGKGIMAAPPSKSMAHRLLIGAGLSKGKSIIEGISSSEDMKATLDCLSAIGAKYEISGDKVEITGADIRNIPEDAVLRCRESGSTLRFFIPICLLDGKTFSLTGSEKLLSRPLSVYEDIFKKQNIRFEVNPDKITLGGKLRSGTYKIKGNISSQFITGLLFVLPLMEEDSVIQLIPPVESRSYINLTIEALSAFGIEIIWQDEKTLFIKGNQSYNPVSAKVEGDYSNAAFFAALNELGSEIEITGLNPDSLQGDKVYEKNFALLGKGMPTINISDCPDLGPILFALAAVKGGGIFTGTRRLKIKESDRASAMAEELTKFGVAVTVHEDSVVVYPHDFHAPTEILNGHNDHRIVMSCAVLSTITGGKIDGAEASAKSLPDFFERLEKLGFEVILHDA